MNEYSYRTPSTGVAGRRARRDRRTRRTMRRISPTKLVAAYRSASLRVEVCVVPCIVTSPPGHCDAIVNAANERLQGTGFTPSECAVRLRGEGLVYPPQVVDGLVAEAGGVELAAACHALPELAPGGIRCRVGTAVTTPAFGELLASYSHVVHAVAPLYDELESELWRKDLTAAFVAAFSHADALNLGTIAVPLLGAGARGAPPEEAAEVAAHS
eukprot:CAMPEP_0115883516 /NCGR_PEP_ID=MMETSP0287-20121206/29606_1 /TAXON_ID=412157 /ORGANISM="Chrysochromulina rotalis, Strain UIO044" /LENGTH=213 /DNA_ID=CAMNT_0003339719 /DNA_START=165 /DNA_END=802 /DNA_ORIENTATION=-